MYTFFLGKGNAKYHLLVNVVFDDEIITNKYGFLGIVEYNYAVLFAMAGKMDHQKGLWYSGDELLTISALRTMVSCPIGDFSPWQKWTDAQGIKRTIEGEGDFHYKFSLIKSKPYIIYYMGNLDLLHRSLLAIVGPRQHSSYATLVLENLFSLAHRYQFATISGLAPGVDQLCHRMSLAKNIPTIAVLGGGLKSYVDSGDRELIQKIVDNGGLVLSEFKLGQEPQTYTFPQRNRIIAGLADVVFLPEAGAGSGSLITANFAIDMHRPVYGVPNSIFSETSLGVNQLIASGAIQTVTDIQLFLDTCFVARNTSPVPLPLPPDLSEDEQVLMSLLGKKEICSLNDFLSASSFSSSELIGLLTLLEMKSCIWQEMSGVYRRK